MVLTKAKKLVVRRIIEDYVNNPDLPIRVIANRYGVMDSDASNYISQYWLYKKINKPEVIVRQSKLNEYGNEQIEL